MKKENFNLKKVNLLKHYIPNWQRGAKIPYKPKESNSYHTMNFTPKMYITLNFTPEEVLDKTISNAFPIEIQKKVNKVIYPVLHISKKLGLDPIFVLSVIWTESSFEYGAKSKKGAKGLMQLMPSTKKHLRKYFKQEVAALTDELRHTRLDNETKENLILGSLYLDFLLKRFQKPQIALAAYNMGPTWVAIKLAEKELVGNNNRYVNKINKKYTLISQSFL